jgi:hypothetical protein
MHRINVRIAYVLRRLIKSTNRRIENVSMVTEQVIRSDPGNLIFKDEAQNTFIYHHTPTNAPILFTI